MRKFMTIVEDTYLKQVKSKSFILLLLLPVIVILISLGAGYFTAANSNSSSNNDDGQIAIVGNDNVKQSLSKLSNEHDYINHSIKDEGSAKKSFKDYNIDGYVQLIQKNGKMIANYVGHSNIDPDFKADLMNIIQKIQSRINIQNSPLSSDQLKQISVQPELNNKIRKDNQSNDDKDDANIAKTSSLPILIFAMYFFLIIYSGVTSSVIANDKGSKIIEVIFSSTIAGKYFVGKILGIILTLLTQVLCYAILLTIGYQFISNNNSMKSLFNEVNPVIHNIFNNFINMNLIFIILGLALGIVLSAISGALVARKEDASKAAQPVIFLIIIVFFASMSLQSNSNGMISKLLSYFPLSSMFFMPIRIINGNVGILEQLISLIILVAFISGLTYCIAKVYKGLMLRNDDSGLIKSVINGVKYR
ncbi:ABC transporter permease [Apilactobacillus micheneri]|uniref:ABC transporter permease n=1 Tax=Apilactobacillus micheneri TaxID=1899430 RepID=UPI0015E8548B|nr:ABC transporter permease [Apilactobacillus micheneri]